VPLLINSQTRVAENLPAEEAQAAFLSGSHNLPRSNPIAMFDPRGELVTVDPSEVHAAITQGEYRLAGDDEVKNFENQQKYGEGLGNTAKAFGEGALRGASFGLSDAALPALGITSTEAVKERKERNPISAGIGNITGVGASLLLAPEASLPGLVSKGGIAASKASAPLVANLATRGAAAKIVAGAVPTAIGSFGEGLAYGTGEVLSEAFLGDPELTAQRAAAQIGLSGVAGGALGAMFGGGSALFSKGAKAATEAAGEAVAGEAGGLAGAGLGGGAIDEMLVAQNAKKTLMEGLTELKKNAPDIVKAAEDIGAPVLPGQLVEGKHLQRYHGLLMDGPTPIAVAEQKTAHEGYKKAEAAVIEALDGTTTKSAAEVGNEIKQTLTSKLQQQAEPIEGIYDQLRLEYGEIPLSERGVKQVAKNILNLDGVNLSASSAEAKLARNVAKELQKLETVDQVRAYKAVMNRSGAPETRYIRGRIAEKLDDLEESTIVRLAKEAGRTPEEKQHLLGLLDLHDAAKVQYKEFRSTMEELGAVLGKKKIYGKQDFLDFIDGLTPETIAKKLYAKGNSEFLSFFKTQFPEEMNQLLALERSKVLNAATKDGVVNTKKVFSEMDALSPELKKIIFSPEQLRKMNSAKTYIEAFPGPINPPNTSTAEAYRRFLTNPFSASAETARDFAIKHALNLAAKTGDAEGARRVQTLVSLERAANKTLRAIQTGTKKAFDSNTLPGYLGAKSAKKLLPKMEDTQEDTVKTYKANVSRIAKMSDNPVGLLDQMEKSTASVYPVAPKVTAGFHNVTVAAVNFLASKIPKPPVPPKPLSPVWVPSRTEMAKFNRYVDVVEQPLDVLKQIRFGSLTKESVEAIATVYPSLYQEMKQEFMTRVTETNRVVPYKMKMMLSLFMGEDMDQSTVGSSIVANQAIINSNSQKSDAPSNGAGKVGPSQSGLGKLDVSGRALTPMQTTANRKA